MLAINIFREYAVLCDDTNNTDATKAQRLFKISIAVKITPTSEEIILDFIASPQGVNVSSNFE